MLEIGAYSPPPEEGNTTEETYYQGHTNLLEKGLTLKKVRKIFELPLCKITRNDRRKGKWIETK